MKYKDIPKSTREQMDYDLLVFGESFCVEKEDGTFERIDPRRYYRKQKHKLKGQNNMLEFKKGDRVNVWSLQSFYDGGFLEGEPAFVRQSQNVGSSVILCVLRNINGYSEIDKNYEVYAEQCKLVKKKHWNAKKELRKMRKQIMGNDAIS